MKHVLCLMMGLWGAFWLHPHALGASCQTSHFVTHVPDGPGWDAQVFACQLGEQLEEARRDVLSAFGAITAAPVLPARIEVVVAESTEHFARRTGSTPWHSAFISTDRLMLQPVPVLTRLADLEATLRHELAHPLVEEAAGRNAPRWLVEGVVMHVAGERPSGYPAGLSTPLSLAHMEEVERVLLSARSGPGETRRAYREAYYAVERLIEHLGGDSGSLEEGLERLLSALCALRSTPFRAWTPGGASVGQILSGRGEVFEGKADQVDCSPGHAP